MKAAPPGGPQTVEELLAEAYTLESEAAQRYVEFAEIMENHNNKEVAQLFRSLAAQEAEHAEQIRRRLGGQISPRTGRGPAAAELEQAHYLMQPWHALQIAIEAERRAHDFYASIVSTCTSAELRQAATQLQAEERQHVALLEQWLGRVPVPSSDWDDDPDPPRYTD